MWIGTEDNGRALLIITAMMLTMVVIITIAVTRALHVTRHDILGGVGGWKEK